MGIISSVIQAVTGSPYTRDDYAFQPMAGGIPTISGQRVSPEGALRLSAYYACLRNISEDIAKLPLKVYRRLPNGGKEELPNHKAYKLLHEQPNEHMHTMSFRETLTHHAMGWGNGYAEISRDGSGRPLAMHPIHPSRVTPIKVNDQVFYRVLAGDISLGGGQGRVEVVNIPARNMIHLRGLGGDGLVGYSVFRLASQGLGLALAAETFGAAFFRSGASVGGIIEMAKKLSPEAKEKIREDWDSKFGGAQNAGKVFIAEEGTKFHRRAIPNNEAQWIESRAFQTAEIARWFRMPPHKIQDLTRSTNNNIEHQGIEYTADAVQPWGVRWELELKCKLFRSQPGVFAAHTYEALMQTDSKSRAAFYKAMWGIGVLSINGIRQKENLNPIGEEGDVHYIPLNMQNAKDAAKPKEDPPPQLAANTDDPAPDGSPPPTPPTPEAPAGDRESPETRRAMIKLAMMPVMADAAQAIINREVKAIRAKLKSGQRPGAFKDWATDFYGGHIDYAERRLAGCVDTMRRVLALPPNAKQAAGIADKYCNDALACVLAFGPNNIEDELDRKLTAAAPEWATAIIDEVSNEVH
jgi:HK97 family phage portal protein